jgi:DNA-binding winged helix-turn-helix (wHTH) protein
MMQEDLTGRTDRSRRPSRPQPPRLSLVGGETAFKDRASARLLSGRRFTVMARSSSLPEALACLDSRGIDLVLLSPEYCEEELNLFTFDARRRGFAGLILHAADAPENIVRVKPKDHLPIQIGDFFIETSSRRVWIRGIEVQCRPMEFQLLQFLCMHPEELLSHQTLFKTLWGKSPTSRPPLRGLIRDVRAKVETTKNPLYIITLREFGYRFIPSPDAFVKRRNLVLSGEGQ